MYAVLLGAFAGSALIASVALASFVAPALRALRIDPLAQLRR